MRKIIALALLALSASPASAADCDAAGTGLSVSRIVEIDATSGPLYGELTRYDKEQRFLAPKEVVLTFDDGPMPWITKSILDTLDRHCTKATFFSVGKMALAYPASVRDVLARGHTLGGHTHTHPLNIARLNTARAKDEIERGFAAIALAAGRPIAPFFRFPGLSDSPALLDHLQQRGIATFTVDVVSNDSFISDPGRLAARTLAEIERRQGGIVLFHDIKASTAKALPTILAELKARGYKLVHMRSRAPLVVSEPHETELRAKFAKTAAATPAPDKAVLVPFYGSPALMRPDAEGAGSGPVAAGPAVTTLAPAPRQRLAAVEPREPAPRSRARSLGRANVVPQIGGWVTRVKRRPQS